jgi:predicted lysophospholipase L1 biosynthesis ABC-type transport system permease subunit
LGIGLALGAQSHSLLWLILRECLVLLIFGLVIGIPVTLSSTRILKSLLYQLSPLDPTAIAVPIVAVASMTNSAAWLHVVQPRSIPRKHFARNNEQPHTSNLISTEIEAQSRDLPDRTDFDLCEIAKS